MKTGSSSRVYLTLAGAIALLLSSARARALPPDRDVPIRNEESHEENDTPAPPPTPTPKSSPVGGLRVDAGYAIPRLVGIPLTGGAAGFSAGAQVTKHAAVWGGLRMFLGSTEYGLRVRSGSGGMDVEGVYDRLRFGIGLQLTILGVERMTKNETILGWGPGANAFVRVDLIQAKGFALYARAMIEAVAEVNDAAYWGPTLGAGVDFDLGDRAGLR